MQLEDHFGVLLRDTVNLSQFRLDTLDDRVSKIYSALRNDSELGTRVLGMSKQGSWAHRTIISPVGENEFDADFMLYLEDDAEWSPQDFLTNVKSALLRSPVYGKMTVNRKNRCVRVVYANSCHIDIVPAISRGGNEYVANFRDDQWEATNPEGFTRWMKEKDEITGGNLRRVIRLMKFLRDHRGSFTGTRSVILTTLLGEQIQAYRTFGDAGYYKNVPTSLVHIISDLDEHLWANPTKPVVMDPSGSGASFDHRWTQETYSYFRERVHAHAAEMRAAYDSTSKDDSVEKWQAQFGEGFKAPSTSESSTPFGEPKSTPASTSLSGRAG
ncbi:SMODS domain-containing nucleotidyltransferase [Microbacterium sp. CGR2]|uniref:SMODS domain-containing nucleotidyltransferase n=2 Tax=unclassified Microbacterium TaxID=2609290 RepID=UPI000EA83D24|nr:nucleotidyltransferase [Microbacterium sp. CGR2]MBT2485920.1 nucleotidyltransferase [Microbacterium sp. ISL-108]RKN68673.1 nucleotidyltransferase [Microbacterium sp. CGR2]